MKFILTAVLICCSFVLPAYSQTPKVISAEMYRFKTVQGDSGLYDKWTGTIDQKGTFAWTSHISDIPVKIGSKEEAFMQAVAGYNATDVFCIVGTDALKDIFGIGSKTIATRDGRDYSRFRVTRTIER